MTKEDKQLLLTDLCARLPYGVVVYYCNKSPIFYTNNFVLNERLLLEYRTPDCCVELKPYLRSMSSMTEEERDFANNEFFKNSDNFQIDDVGEMYTESQPFESIYTLSLKIQSKYLDWLNSHHFDYRRLIERGLALETPEGMYK